ncbi:MAG: ABC transporter permease, partial [Methylobacteriaceae bacterium]|nr:ABC transporter permease [Methylobacteriaceae bacterium]
MNRASYTAARLLQIVPTFILIGIVVFVLVRILPGGPVAALLGDKASDEAIERITRQLGLDAPIPVQFWRFLETIARGDLGDSIAYHVAVVRLIADRLPVTLLLTGMATVLAIALAVPLSFVAAVTQNRWPDLAIRGAFQVGLSSPIFYVGLILLTVFAGAIHIFPVGGYGETPQEHLYHLFLPALALALSFSAVIMRSLRASVIDVLSAEFVDFA